MKASFLFWCLLFNSKRFLTSFFCFLILIFGDSFRFRLLVESSLTHGAVLLIGGTAAWRRARNFLSAFRRGARSRRRIRAGLPRRPGHKNRRNSNREESETLFLHNKPFRLRYEYEYEKIRE